MTPGEGLTVAKLSKAHCILLAVHYASESKIESLHYLTPQRPDAFDPEFVLRILLTYLPETLDPSLYTTYVNEVATRLYLEQREQHDVDLAPVNGVSSAQAEKRVQKLNLLPLTHPSSPTDAPDDLLTRFLIHRAHRIDAQSGVLTLLPQLFVPFLDRSSFLRVWYISTILPLLRFDYEYYPLERATLGLEAFEGLEGAKGVEVLLSKGQRARKDGAGSETDIGRDLRGLVGPWMYGDNYRKRRRIDHTVKRQAIQVVVEDTKPELRPESVKERERDSSWQYVFNWLVSRAAKDLPVSVAAIEEWAGPGDVDLGGYDEGLPPLHEEDREQLHLQYVQAAFAAVYAAETDDAETIEAAHSVLVRLASIMDFEPPPGLATSIDLLPKLDRQTADLHQESVMVLQPGALLRPDHPLTTPKLQTFSVLQIFVYSSYILASLNYRIAIANVAKLRFFSDDDEQLQILQRILHGLTSGARKDDDQWVQIRNKLEWLWHWGMDADDEGALHASGIFGQIDRATFEKEILKAFLSGSNYSLAAKLYITESKSRSRLVVDEIEKVILEQALYHYDNASNGNRTRGAMRKASDIIATFRPYFLTSKAFSACEALLAATHALSFYSLTLQHGVPFQPVNIRVSQDPVSLIQKLLDQNPGSYAELDNLVEIAKNLVAAHLTYADQQLQNEPMIERRQEELESQQRNAERRVTGMAIEAALAEGDFETAYSYVINRLTPTSETIAPSGISAKEAKSAAPHQQLQAETDDISWRAAFQAGRARSVDLSSRVAGGRPGVRRLEQRMELLSQALLLAPPSALAEILGAWRRCEEEMTALLAREDEEEERINDIADKRLPGGYTQYTQTPTIQPRREIGRGAVEEAPMGLFDVARGAAAAFSRSAFPLRGAAQLAGQLSGLDAHDYARGASNAGSESGSLDAGGSDVDERIRKRDIVANAVTEGLASGLSWMLGAKPVHQSR